MSKKKSTDIEDSIKNLNISAVMGGESTLSTVKGKTVSLNLKRESFLGIGSMWLTPKNYTATVPDNLTPAQEKQVRQSLDLGILVEGDIYIPPIDRRDSVLEEYWQLVKLYGLDAADPKSKSMPAFRKLLKMGVDRNWTAKEVAKYCIKQETAFKNREKVLKLLQDLHKNSLCPDTLLEPIK